MTAVLVDGVRVVVAIGRCRRAALGDALAATGRVPDPGAYRFPHARVSLSHTEGRVAAAAVDGEPAHVVGVGIDVERRRPTRPDTWRFFLTVAEREWLASVPAAERGEAHVRLWTVKEALFKADPANAHTWLGDYAVADAAAPRSRARRGDLELGYVTTMWDGGYETVAVAFGGRAA